MAAPLVSFAIGVIDRIDRTFGESGLGPSGPTSPAGDGHPPGCERTMPQHGERCEAGTTEKRGGRGATASARTDRPGRRGPDGPGARCRVATSRSPLARGGGRAIRREEGKRSSVRRAGCRMAATTKAEKGKAPGAETRHPRLSAAKLDRLITADGQIVAVC